MLNWRRTKSLMFVIAATALLLAGAEQVASLKMVATGRREMAWLHATQARSVDRALQRNGDEVVRDWLVQLSRHHRMLEQKYRDAAARPWSRVPPDPPPPALRIR